MLIDQKTLAEVLQVGSQYFLPVAALLRALYYGARGRFPEGFLQIAVASVFAGVTAVVNGSQPDVVTILRGVLGNTAFTAGLLAFIMVYLLRTNWGLWADGLIGAGIGLIFWLVWVYILANPWPWWTIPLAIAAGAAGFIALRYALRTIALLVKVATYLIVIGVIIVIGAGGFMLFQTLTAPR
jgi:hypothetical protein